MNKIYRSNLRLNGQFDGKNHQPTFNDLVCEENHFKRINTNPKIILHIYVHSHYQKERLIKNCILFLFGRVC
jgi:hypothetical protein